MNTQDLPTSVNVNASVKPNQHFTPYGTSKASNGYPFAYSTPFKTSKTG
jgi:hypothetical protein